MSNYASAIAVAIKERRSKNLSSIVPFLTAGFPLKSSTKPFLFALQKANASVVELGIPFSEAVADGPVICSANDIALKQGVDINFCFETVSESRKEGLTVPIVLMGYYNPIRCYGEENFIKDAIKAGCNACLVCDLPFEESKLFRKLCQQYSFGFVPVVAPSTPYSRIQDLCSDAKDFIYIVSRMTTTGVSVDSLRNSSIMKLCSQVRSNSNSVPCALGFGIASTTQVKEVLTMTDAAIIGSKLISVINENIQESTEIQAQKLEKFVTQMSDIHAEPLENYECSLKAVEHSKIDESKKINGRFGRFGGQYASEALMVALHQLEACFVNANKDEEFWNEYRSYFAYMNRPSTLHKAEMLTEFCKGAQIWLKREDLNHTGSHKINNAIGQALIAKRMGKTRLITETGAGQNGVAVASVAAKLGMKCTVYMGADDCKRQALNVFRIKLLGGDVIPVSEGLGHLKDAVTASLRAWVTMLDEAHYVVGSAVGPHPFPIIVRTFQSVIGQETKSQFKSQTGKLPDAVTACVGAGSNCSGMFSAFIEHENVQLYGFEAAGSSLNDARPGAAALSLGTPGILNGSYSLILQDKKGQIIDSESISAGLDYPGVGPELAYWKDIGRAKFEAIENKQALIGFKALACFEGIIVALETSHAVYGAMKLAKQMKKDKNIVICISGRGDKDVATIWEKRQVYDFDYQTPLTFDQI